MMDDNFRRLIEDTLISVEEAVEESGAPIDYYTHEREIRLEFANNAEILLHADLSNGYLLLHSANVDFTFVYHSDNDIWQDINGGGELFKVLGQICTQHTGRTIRFD
jgi:CyaY protein